MRPLHTVVLAGLLVTAGCNGLGPADPDPRTVAPGLRGTPAGTADTTTTPAPTPESSFPPGVTPGESDQVDESAIYPAHERALANRSVTWRSQHLRVNATGTVLGWATRTGWVDGAHQRYEVETGGVDPAAVRLRVTTPEYWTNGTVTASRLTLADGTSAVQVREGGPVGSFADVGTGRIVPVLAGVDLQYVGSERRNDAEIHVLAGTRGDARLTMRVTSEGVVRSFTHRTHDDIDGARITFVTRFRTYDVGSTVVERPAWAGTPTGSTADERGRSPTLDPRGRPPVYSGAVSLWTAHPLSTSSGRSTSSSSVSSPT